jgi:hypothetical protein
MKNRKSTASLLIFVGSTLCFFLPFVTMSCGGIKAFTLTGQQLATGTTLTQPQPFGPPQTQKVDGDAFAALAGVCSVVGVVLSLIGRRMGNACVISGGVGAASLLIMRSRLDAQIQRQGQGLATVNYETGFTLAIVLLLAGAALNIYLFLQSRRIKDAGNTSTAVEREATGERITPRGSPQQSPDAPHT